MKQNVGTIDRIIRLILGVGIIGAGIYYQSWWGILGILPLATGGFGLCGIYALFGVNTCTIPSPKD